jgi:hypothetical protein
MGNVCRQSVRCECSRSWIVLSSTRLRSRKQGYRHGRQAGTSRPVTTSTTAQAKCPRFPARDELDRQGRGGAGSCALALLAEDRSRRGECNDSSHHTDRGRPRRGTTASHAFPLLARTGETLEGDGEACRTSPQRPRPINFAASPECRGGVPRHRCGRRAASTCPMASGFFADLARIVSPAEGWATVARER